MTQDEFIDKWLVGYESREQKEEFAIEMMADLASLQSKGKTKEEVIKSKYPFYNPDIAQKDIEINAEAAMELMEEYAQSHANQDGLITAEEAKKLLAIRDALVINDIDEAYHQLRILADPNTERINHWEIWEKLLTPPQP